jgi:hypothetical protein
MDFGEFLAFRKFFTPIAIQVIFWLGVLGVIIASLSMMFRGAAGFFAGLIWLVVGTVLVRVYCELLILLFRIYDELRAIRTGVPPTDPGFPVIPVTPVPPVTPTAPMPSTPGAPMQPPTATA